MSKTLKYGSHDFPSKFGFSGSAGDGPVNVRPHVRARRHAPKMTGPKLPGPIKPISVGKSPMAKALKMADGGAPSIVPSLRPAVDVVDQGGGAVFGGGAGVGSGSVPETNRLSESVGRGHAPLTIGGLAAALQNAMGVVDPVKMGIMTGVENLTGQPPGTLGGVQDIPGYEGYSPETQAAVKSGKIRTMSAATAADAVRSGGGERATRDASGAVHGGSYGPGDVTHENTQTGQLGHIAKGGRIRKRYAKGGCVTEPKAERIAERKVAAHNANPRAHSRRGVPAFKSKPMIGD